MYESRTAPLATRAVFFHRILRSTLVVSAIIGGSLVVGIVGYRYFEGMAWIDAFLNAAMLLGGMGEIGELHTRAGKLFAGIFAIYAGMVALVAASVLLAPAFHRFIHRFHLQSEK